MASYLPPHLRGVEQGTSPNTPDAHTSDIDDRPHDPKSPGDTKDTVSQHRQTLVYTMLEIATIFGPIPNGTKATTLNTKSGNPKTLAFILLFKDPAPNYLGRKILAKSNTNVLLTHPLSAKSPSHNTRFPEFSHLDVSGAVFPVFQGRGPRGTPGGLYEFWQCLGWFRLSTVEYLEPGSSALAKMLQRTWGNKRRTKQRWLEALMEHWFVIEAEMVEERKGDNPMNKARGRKIQVPNSSLVAGSPETERTQVYGTSSTQMLTLMEVLDGLPPLKEAAEVVERRKEAGEYERRQGAAKGEDETRNRQSNQQLTQKEASPQTTRNTRVSDLQEGADSVSEAASENLIQFPPEYSSSRLEMLLADLDNDETLRDIPRWLRWVYLPPGSCAGFLPEPNWW